MKLMRAEIKGISAKLKKIREKAYNENPVKSDMVSIGGDVQEIMDDITGILHDQKIRFDNRISEKMDLLQYESDSYDQDFIIERC